MSRTQAETTAQIVPIRSKMFRLTIATRNAHKTREFANILGPDFFVSDLSAVLSMQPIEEIGETFAENAILKAVTVSAAVAGWVLADDSGLEVAALNNAPGVRSARFAGENARDSENVAKLLHAIAAADPEERNREARFCCVLALARAGELVQVVQGTVEGRLASAAKGENGFGYDPVFLPVGYDQTFAELGDSIKNRISHRARAVAALREYLRQRGDFDLP